MKVTFLLPGNSSSGGCRVTMQMGNCLLKRGYNIRIAYRKDPPFSRDRLVSYARFVKYHLQRAPETRWLAFFQGELAPFITLSDLKFEPGEIVIATGEHTIPELRDLRADVVTVRYCHGFLEREPQRMQLVWGGPMRTIAVSPGLVPTLEQYCESPVLAIVPNGVDESEYFASDSRRDGVGFIFHGSPLKGSEVAPTLIEALRLHFPTIPRYIFGSYPRPAGLSSSEYTRYPSIKTARELYNRSKVWLVLSRDEGFCLPILEAMACGCSVVTSRHTNASDLVQHGTTGFIVPHGDVGGYIQCTDQLLKDPQLRSRIVEQGFLTVSQFTWQRAADKMERALAALVTEPHNFESRLQKTPTLTPDL